MWHCEKHGTDNEGPYPCWQCQDGWVATHPKTATAVALMASGEGSYSAALAAYRRAKKAETP